MNTSPEINELAGALAKAQAEISGAHKDSKNPAFKKDGKESKYATLESVWDACREPLTKNGLSVVQTVHVENNGYFLKTMLCHSSGQFIQGMCPLLLMKNDMQGLYASSTYARRLSLSAMIGICPTDDDGNEACKPPATKQARPFQQTAFNTAAQYSAPQKHPQDGGTALFTVASEQIDWISLFGKNLKAKCGDDLDKKSYIENSLEFDRKNKDQAYWKGMVERLEKISAEELEL